nr:CHAT domain-containing protein [Glycomyces amatae]
MGRNTGGREPEPEQEKLRILLLGASSEGDLRVAREQKRIRTAVEIASHRDSIEFDARPAATADDLLDGITGFRPHVLHFSGHGGEHGLTFEIERDEHHYGARVTVEAFGLALEATDAPPQLILLNSCRSAALLDTLLGALTDQAVPFAIGMNDKIGDGCAIDYAARFYASIANGRSVDASHAAGRAALSFAGLGRADLPTLQCAEGADPKSAVLVRPPAV